MVWKKILFEVLRQLSWWHNTVILPAVSIQSPVLCPTNLATALYKYADDFLSFEQFRKVTLLSLSNI